MYNERVVQLKLPIGPPEKDCPKWEGCAAPLCPMSPGLRGAVWFPFESVCRLESYAELRWVKTQVAIARLPRRKERGYFTIAMLKAIREVGPGTTGKKDDEKPERQTAAGVKKLKKAQPRRRRMARPAAKSDRQPGRKPGPGKEAETRAIRPPAKKAPAHPAATPRKAAARHHPTAKKSVAAKTGPRRPHVRARQKKR